MRHYINLFLTVSIVLFSVPVAASSSQYAVIIDAGSSGSRAHVFEYTNASPTLPIPAIKDVFSQSITPGLSSFVNNPAAAGASLKPILDGATLFLQNRGVNVSDVPISVLATAGMRLLTPSEQETIYASVRHFLHDNSTFLLKDQDVQTLSGKMEGFFGWLDINYLQNKFSQPTKTVGSIDMGGASTQIAFATTDTSRPEDEINITINHTVYRIFSHSFLGLGQDQARKAMSATPSATSCHPNGYTMGSQTGNFDFSTCSPIYTGIIQEQNIAKQMIPTEGQSFVAYAGIYYTYNFFSILKTPTQSALQSQINATCYQPWETLQRNHPNTASSFLSSYCANAVYFDSLLYNTYQLQGYQLTVTNEINGTGIDWTLGALLYDLV